MVVRVHDRTSYGRADTHVSFSACLADGDQFVVDVADFADRGSAVHSDLSDFAGRKSYLSVSAFLGHQLSAVAGCSAQLSAFAGLQFDAVDDGTDGDIRERQGVAGLDIRCGAAVENVADLQAVGSDDVFRNRKYKDCYVPRS